MTYYCQYCKFKWDFSDGDIQKVFLHEKTHKKSRNSNYGLDLQNKICSCNCGCTRKISNVYYYVCIFCLLGNHPLLDSSIKN